MLKLLGAAALLGVLREAQRPLPPDPPQAPTKTQARSVETLTTGQVIDRVATRFGAFAVVAVVSYPLVAASSGLRAAKPYDLPELRDATGVIWFTHSAATLLTVVAVFFAFSAFLPVWKAAQKKAMGWRWWTGVLAAVPMGLIVMLYILLCIFTLMQSENEIIFGKLARDLSVLQPACGPHGLRSETCEAALNLCLEAKTERNACTLAIRDAIACGWAADNPPARVSIPTQLRQGAGVSATD